MKKSQINPQLRFLFPVLWHAPLAKPGVIRLLRYATMLVPAAPLPKGMTREVLKINQHASARIFTPKGGGSGAALVWIHGGGTVIGAAIFDDLRCIQAATKLNIVVVSVEYRLAPQYPFPAPLDDCQAVWDWLQENADSRGIDRNRIAVGGQSAGGGLAAALAQRLHDQAGNQPAGQWLFCPMLDDRVAARRELDAINHVVWNNQSSRFVWAAYLGTEPGSVNVPEYASASRRKDLSGLPPAWIGMGDIELFFGEGRAYFGDLRNAGVSATLVVAKGAPHAFETPPLKTRLGSKYLQAAHDWLGAILS